MGARLYDPTTGLFMSPDPTVSRPYDTQDLNQYAYVGDNPMTYTDPAGLDSCDGQPSPCTPLPKLTVNGQGCITDANPTCQLIHLWDDAAAGHRGYSGANNRLYNYDNYGGTQKQSKKGPCGKGSSNASDNQTSLDPGNISTKEKINNTATFVRLVAIELTDADVGGDVNDAVAVGQLAQYTFGTTIQKGLNDIRTWQSTGGHLVSSGGSAINWSALQVPWQDYGGQSANELGSGNAIKLNQYTTLSCYFQSHQ